VKYLRGLTGWRACLAAALLGVVAALALPPVTLVPVLLISIPGLLALIDDAPTWRGAALRGFCFGTAHHLAGLYWVTEAVLVEAREFWWAIPIAVPMLAATLALFIAAPCALARLASPGWRRVAMLAGCWELGDLARQFALTGFPWNPLGSVWEFPGWLGLAFMQPAAWVGVGGLTLLTLLLAAAPYAGRNACFAAAGVLALWGSSGATRLNRPAGPPPGQTAVIVQGDVSEIEHRDHWQDPGWARAIFMRHLQLTQRGVAQADGAPSIVFWPETASPYWLQQEPEARADIAAAMKPALAAIVGTARAAPPDLAYNSLVAIMPDGRVAAYYDKHHLVPYGEYFPSYLPIRLGERGWDAGPGLKTLHIPGLPPIGPLICYEAAFSAEAVVEKDRPAMIVNLTNDSWFGESAGPRQHLAAARMRAVEEGLPVVRAANTGISAIIDAHGAVLKKLGLDKQGIVVGQIPGALPPTPFSRMGLAAPLMLSLLSCGAGFGVAGRERKHNCNRLVSKKTVLDEKNRELS
jgi:apolipoprotein N-acyltransferase